MKPAGRVGLTPSLPPDAARPGRAPAPAKQVSCQPKAGVVKKPCSNCGKGPCLRFKITCAKCTPTVQPRERDQSKPTLKYLRSGYRPSTALRKAWDKAAARSRQRALLRKLEVHP